MYFGIAYNYCRPSLPPNNVSFRLFLKPPDSIFSLAHSLQNYFLYCLWPYRRRGKRAAYYLVSFYSPTRLRNWIHATIVENN